MKNKLTIVRSRISYDNDYSYIYKHALHNMLEPYKKWASENSVSMSFEHYTDQDFATMQLRLAVIAEFPCPTELALFKITFGKFPLTHIDIF